MSPITTHVLDTARGRPAAGVSVTLEIAEGESFRVVGAGVTDADGRVRDLLPAGALQAAVYRIGFALAPYFAAQNISGFYPVAQIVFQVENPQQHYHVPLLLSPFGYSTYRGS